MAQYILRFLKNTMQIYAIDSQGQLISAYQANRSADYLCPACHARLRLRGGPLRQEHFYHLAASSCHLHHKSPTHLQIQYALLKSLAPEEVEMEKRFATIGRIADLFWPARKLVFEIQVSAISAEEIKARNADYGRLGYQVIWILHDRQFNGSFLSEAEAHLLSMTHYFTNINPQGKGMFYDQYASCRLGRRLTRSPRFPISLKQIRARPRGAASHLSHSRRCWLLSCPGDFFDQAARWSPQRGTASPWARLCRLYRNGIYLLLEKNCA